jgi:hypothetical protein
MIFRHRDTWNLSSIAFSLSRAHLPVDGRSHVLDRSVVLKNEARTFLPGPFTLTDFLLAFRECALAGSETVETERIGGDQRLPKPQVPRKSTPPFSGGESGRGHSLGREFTPNAFCSGNLPEGTPAVHERLCWQA